MMTTLVYVIAYLGIVFFLIAVVARFFFWSKMPMHLRWELYPVAHEGGGRAAYGGSYLEESDWWKKKREVSLLGELRVMVPEILFLVALREHNKKLWTRSFPFHFGLYLVGATTIMLMINGVSGALLPAVIAGPVNTISDFLAPWLGGAGLVFGIIGAIGLFLRRRGRELRDYTAPADLFNLAFFIVAFGVAFITFVGYDLDFSMVSAFVANLVTFNLASLGSGTGVLLLMLSVVLLSLLTAYIPTTHMSHFVGKYFAYHAIRWKDDPNLPGGDEEKVIEDLLSRPISWSAEHIKGDGKKTWLEAATEEPEVKDK
ncbi:MAG: nitrate reductase [Acidobacteria bacterium]|jgi:nitrate reductase gamma subunit|nr:nitrate reductase [Acidobacteriota bacterium]